MTDNQTRRRFFGKVSSAGFGLAAIGGLPSESLAASKSPKKGAKETMLEQYFRRFGEILVTFRKNEMENIEKAADLAVECLESGGKLYTSLGGHLFYQDGGDTAIDRIGNPELFIRDTKEMKAGDFLVTMNASQANEARKKGIKVVGWTSPFHRKGDTPPLGLQNPQALILEEVCHVTVECYVPYTDGILFSEKIHVRPIPGSGQMTILFYWVLTSAIVDRLAKKGKTLKVAGT